MSRARVPVPPLAATRRPEHPAPGEYPGAGQSTEDRGRASISRPGRPAGTRRARVRGWPVVLTGCRRPSGRAGHATTPAMSRNDLMGSVNTGVMNAPSSGCTEGPRGWLGLPGARDSRKRVTGHPAAVLPGRRLGGCGGSRRADCRRGRCPPREAKTTDKARRLLLVKSRGPVSFAGERARPRGISRAAGASGGGGGEAARRGRRRVAPEGE
jgi:hypothetical protein